MRRSVSPDRRLATPSPSRAGSHWGATIQNADPTRRLFRDTPLSCATVCFQTPPRPSAALTHSARSTNAMGVRAAIRPGMAATTFASTSAPTAMITTVRTGTFGAGTTWISRAKRSQSHRPTTMPRGTPTIVPMTDGDARLPGDGRGELAVGEAEGLQQREVPPAPAHRSDEGEPEGDDRTDREPGARDGRRSPHRAVVDDLGRPLHREHRDAAVSGRAGGLRHAPQ